MPKTKEPTEAEKAAAKETEAQAVRLARETRADVFKALGDPIRLAICEYLAASAPGEQTAGSVCRAVTGDKKITAKVSHHLKELRRAGLIVMHKKGKNVLCGLDLRGTAALCAYLAAWGEAGAFQTSDFAEGNPTDGDAAIQPLPDFSASSPLLHAA